MLFFVNFQLISFTQLALHDIRRETQANYIYSYILSLIVTSVIIIEMIRAWSTVSQINVDPLKLKEKDEEKWRIYEFWTSHLETKEQKIGNTYMIRDKIRWTLFQLIIVTLQKNSAMQILLATIVDIIYLYLVFKEMRAKRIFKNLGTRIQYVCQEIAILIFLIVLSVFALVSSSEFKKSAFYNFMQTIVIVSVFVAVFSQVISILWGVKDFIVDYFEARKLSKLKKITEALDKAEKDARLGISEEVGVQVQDPSKTKLNPQITAQPRTNVVIAKYREEDEEQKPIPEILEKNVQLQKGSGEGISKLSIENMDRAEQLKSKNKALRSVMYQEVSKTSKLPTKILQKSLVDEEVDI